MTDFVQKTSGRLVLAALAALALATPAYAEADKPASDKPASDKAVSSQDGKYFDANGEPTYKIGPDGKVDWYTYSGFQRYSAECLRCHGPDGMGSSYAPALANSLKTLSYADFLSTVANGRKNLENGQEKVMPTLGLDKNVMCFIDDIYIYLKARSDDAVGRGRPPAKEPKPKTWEDGVNACMGPPS
ncbi:methanol metabolism-related c-type cytochrome [Rhodoblastus acidophilus]|nr:methanol metabolism-related c-type cytochrome [Rhodoblastus acidophilus]MCW2332471.1 methanol metabolism-related c-type cytochrome [Rhodoblastus acidophilus]